MNFSKTKWNFPYKITGRTRKVNIPGLTQKGKGVYIIKDAETGIIMYVGKSGNNLYKTLLRHFQSWNDKRQQRFTYEPEYSKVRVIYTNTQKQADVLEELLIKKYKPSDNIKKLQYFINLANEKYIENVQDAYKNSEEIAPF